MTFLHPKRLLALWFAGLALAAGPAAAADDETVVRALKEGRYQELSSLKREAERGDPAAMYWHSVLLEACAIDGSCPREEAYRWVIKAAKAGHPRARIRAFSLAAASATVADPYYALGEPRNDEERVIWALAVIGTVGLDPKLTDQGLQALRAVHERAPTMLSAHSVVMWDAGPRAELLPALLLAGTPLAPQASEELRRHYLLNKRMRYPQLLELAKQGDAAVGIALCYTTLFVDGHSQLPAELLPLCVGYLEQGQLGLASELLKHHLERSETAQARRYARLCTTLPLPCSEPLSDYERLSLGDTQAWRDRDATLAIANGLQTDDKLPVKVRRDALSLATRLLDAKRACILRPYDPRTKTFAPTPGCLWGQPIKLDD